MLKQPTHDFLLETSVDYHTSCFATLRSFSSSLLLSRHYSTLVEESRRYQRELSDRGCSPEEAEEIVGQVLDANSAITRDLRYAPFKAARAILLKIGGQGDLYARESDCQCISLLLRLMGGSS